MDSSPGILLMSMSLDFGGAETHVISLAKALQRQGKRVLVASNGGRLVRELDEAGIAHHQVALHARRPLNLLGSILLVKRLVEREQIELMHAHARIPAWVGKWVGMMTGVPLVTTYHGLYDDHWLLRLFTVSGKQTIAVSDDVKQHLVKKLGISAGQITVIPNGIDVSRFTLQELPGTERIITYISRLAGGRGGVALTVIQSIELLLHEFPDIDLQIVGEGDRLVEVKAAADRVNRVAGRDVCKVLGGLADIPTVLAKSGIVIGVGRVALEAMTASRPVVVASEYGNYGWLREQNFEMAEGHNFSGRGADTSTSAQSVSEALYEMLKAPDVATREAHRIRQLISAKYSADETAKRVLQVYAKIKK